MRTRILATIALLAALTGCSTPAQPVTITPTTGHHGEQWLNLPRCATEDSVRCVWPSDDGTFLVNL